MSLVLDKSPLVLKGSALKTRLTAVILLSCLNWAIVWFTGDHALPTIKSWPLIVQAFLPLLIFPRRAAIGYGLFVCLFLAGAEVASQFKLELTKIPLAWADFKVFLLSPDASLKALMLPGYLHKSILIGVPCLLVVLVVLLGGEVFRAKEGKLRALAFVLVALMAANIAKTTSAAASTYIARNGVQVGEIAGFAKAMRIMGLPAFLAYTSGLEQISLSKYMLAKPAQPPSDAVVADAANTYLAPPAAGPTKLPNIVAVLAESTFDPNQVFKLKNTYSDYLLSDNPLTHARGILSVTPIGGGTWVSEFEVFTGINTELFGHQGRYAHTALAPHTRQTIISWLRGKGYATAAYYATDAQFFNARNAFRLYGFERDLENRDLGFDGKGWRIKDTAIIDAVIKKSRQQKSDKPFFKYVQLLENHAPHTCAPYKSEAELKTLFAGKAGFERNCQLNVYLDRMQSTGRAVQKLAAYLAEEEARTGRPFVIVVFGDHQPHTFTSTWSSKHDFTKLRKVADPRYAMYHVLGSAKNRLKINRDQILPMSLLPTLISAYAARDNQDLFQAVNLYALQQCGYKYSSAHEGPQLRGTLSSGARQAVDTGECSKLDALIADYKRSAIMKF